MQKAIAVLKKLEWSGTAHFQLYTESKCPICGGLKSTEWPRKNLKYGHEPDCELAQLLRNKPDTTPSLGLEKIAAYIGRLRQLRQKVKIAEISEKCL